MVVASVITREENPMNNSITQSTRNLIAIILIIACALVPLSGCTGLQDAITHTTAWRDDAVVVQSDLQAQLSALEHQQNQLPVGSPDAPYIDAAISRTRAKIQTINAAVSQADLVIQEATNPQSALTQTVDAISPWIPAPAQGPVILGAALLATLVRSRNLKNSATSIIQSIEHTMNRDPVFKDVFAQNADTIRTIQTPGARKLIDSTVQRSRATKQATK